MEASNNDRLRDRVGDRVRDQAGDEGHDEVGDGAHDEVGVEVGDGVLEVDCGTCVMRDTDACDDCLVTYICDREPADAVIITIDELRAMRTLSDAGLVPGLKHQRCIG